MKVIMILLMTKSWSISRLFLWDNDINAALASVDEYIQLKAQKLIPRLIVHLLIGLGAWLGQSQSINWVYIPLQTSDWSKGRPMSVDGVCCRTM